tara:strand:- start:1992 stop:2168 length:177 start_codon:yes stop_codon:yes gene_type:complete
MKAIIEKLMSRKLLVVVVAAVAAWIGVPGLGGAELQEIFMAYIGGQAVVDASAALRNG